MFEGHYVAWKHGIQHRDITPSNLMYKMDGDDMVGVLIDFNFTQRCAIGDEEGGAGRQH
ncbi:hypothetical protein L210DRAFT_857453 [Boletus edulis BED1]|uniref:Protein kinase domain-containing protein n=1 Tax=Boletus edulis BED1 TaxID=1328754 RepID=A0AAD4GEZ9_BOLED|nr:hypothetical protein L210DRAFT_857453 [Boletus edulis BED1]